MIIICLLLLVNSFTMAQNKEPVTVDHVDLQKYAGTWYEIAKIPNSFQDQCVGNTTATYSLNDDGSIIRVEQM